jgi:hypothetical protein
MKNRSIVGAIAAAGLFGLFSASMEIPKGHANVSDDDSAGDNSRIKRGFDIAPVRLNLGKKNRALVGLGSYIVNAQGGCNDCHTWPNYAEGHDPFLGQPVQVNTDGYLGGGRPFGPFVSRNITPDENGLPAGLTRDEFIEAIRTGVDKDGELLQVMPWPVYHDMTDHVLNAIYEYLSTIPSLDGPGPRE